MQYLAIYTDCPRKLGETLHYRRRYTKQRQSGVCSRVLEGTHAVTIANLVPTFDPDDMDTSKSLSPICDLGIPYLW